MLIKTMFAGCIVGMAMMTNAFAEITNKSGDFDAGPFRDMVNAGLMCKSADTLFEFYEKVPPEEQGREKFVDSFLKQHLSKGDCWEVRPSSAFLTGFRYADVKRADKKLPSVVIIPRIVVSGRVGFILPITLRMNLPDVAQAIKQKNEERGWPAIQIGDDPTPDSNSDETADNFFDLIRARASEGWARPPSSRNGMTVVLQIEMLQDGTVKSVSVAKSSGDAPYDASAVAAIKNIGRLTEMQNLKPSDFQPYRSFKMTFTPEDLAL